MGTQEEAAAAAAKRAEDEARYNALGDKNRSDADRAADLQALTFVETDNSTDAERRRAAEMKGSEDAHYANLTKFKNPGAAEYGGGPGMGDMYRDIALNDRKNNDALQSATSGAMNYGLGQMTGNRGPMAMENGRLTGREAQSRGQQQDALNMSMQAAMGGAPSQIQGQTTQAMNGLMGSRASAMGGARGLSALNGAGLGGSAMGNQAGGLAAQGGFGRSQEIGTAMGQYGELSGAARGQDLSRLGQNSQMSNFNADLNDKWKLGQGQNAVNAAKVGNSFDLTDQARYGASMQPAEMQFGADQESQGWEAGAETDKSALASAKDAAKRKSDHDLYMGIGGSVVTAAGTAGGGPLGGAAAGAAWNASGGGTKFQ